MSQNIVPGLTMPPAAGGSGASVVPLGAAPDLGSFMRKVFAEAQPGNDGQPRGALLRRDYETAFDLLTRASGAFQVLMKRCQDLEDEVRRTKEQAWADVDAATRVKKQWQTLAANLKVHLEESDAQLTALKQRLEATEARVEAERELTEMAEQNAAVAIDLTTLFHDKIVAAFGIGSQAHAALDAVATGAVNLQTPPPPTKP